METAVKEHLHCQTGEQKPDVGQQLPHGLAMLPQWDRHQIAIACN